MIKYIKPAAYKEDFHCPYCSVYAQQTWGKVTLSNNIRGFYVEPIEWKGAKCNHCNKISMWFNDKMIFPDNPNIFPPNEDLRDDIKKDYNEAATIVEKSPRAAEALLRLAVQKLCKQLGEKGEDLNEDIASLVKRGLPSQMQQSLDIVRVVGNESVHPGQINLNDDKEIAYRLFELINIITQAMISQPKEIAKLYSTLPKAKLEGIRDRDLDKNP